MAFHDASSAPGMIPGTVKTAQDRVLPQVFRGQRHGVYLLGGDDPIWHRIDHDESIPIYRKKIWKDLIEETYKNPGEYLAAFDHGRLVEILPFFLIRDPLMRKKLISTPYQGSAGGFTTADSEVRRWMIEYAKEYGRELHVQYVEIRSADPVPELEQAGFVLKQPLITTVLPLSTREENWALLSTNHRRNLRMAAKAGVRVETARDWAEMKIFYEMLEDHYKSLGVPFMGEKFFRLLWERLIQDGRGTLLLARHEENIIGGHLLLFNGPQLVSKFSIAMHQGKYEKMCTSYALYWEAILAGIERGLTSFDLGITGEANAGLRHFKSHLGGEEKRLCFYYYRLKGKLPDYEKLYGSYQFVKKLWRLAPRKLTKFAGEYINRWIC